VADRILGEGVAIGFDDCTGTGMAIDALGDAVGILLVRVAFFGFFFLLALLGRG